MRTDVALEVWVARNDFGRDIQIAVVLDGEGKTSVARVVEGGHLEYTDSPRGGMITPTIRLSEHMAERLLAGLLENKVKTPTAGAIEGELKATKYHLEDLRRVLKIPKRPEP